MSDDTALPSHSSATALVLKENKELMQRNRALRAETERLLQENAALSMKVSDLLNGMQCDRSSRSAALNLMEDAVIARKAADKVASHLQSEIVERQRIEAALREADRRKDEFLATLAHELRNPLSPILIGIELLKLNGCDNRAVTGIQETLERQVKHLVRLVDDLLEVSRITRGKFELRREAVELASVVRSALEDSKPTIEKGKHTLHVTLPAKPVILFGDHVRLAQVIANLLSNAAKYTEPGGTISLTARRDGSEAVITVADNGLGIPSEMLPRVFNLFTQIDRYLDRAQGGLGIGLTLANNLVTAHGGTIIAKSDGAGKGAEFIIHLPLLEANAAPTEKATPVKVPEPQKEPHRILVVDDNKDAADSLATLLKFMGYETCIANDGPSALEQFSNFHPEAVLLDIGMPGMDGNEVARRMRERPGGDSMLMIAITGWGQTEDRNRSKQAGFNHHVVKPIEVKTLQNLLRGLSDDDPGSDHAEATVEINGGGGKKGGGAEITPVPDKPALNHVHDR